MLFFYGFLQFSNSRIELSNIAARIESRCRSRCIHTRYCTALLSQRDELVGDNWQRRDRLVTCTVNSTPNFTSASVLDYGVLARLLSDLVE